MEENEFYFKDAFSQSEGKTNLTINNLTAACISSSNNKFSLDSEGNLVVNTIQATGNTSTGSGYDIDKVYPIGAIYMSVNSTNPNTLFGGTWERIMDKFLLCSGDTYANASTGGNATTTLNVDNLPSHTHTGSTSSEGAHTHTGSTSTTGNHVHNLYYRTVYSGSGDYNGVCRPTAGTGISTYMDEAGSHTHSFTTGSNGTHSHSFTTGATGSGAEFNNMPPYLAVYVWKRVS